MAAQPNPYLLNPFEGKILPGTAAGSKLYLTATKEEQDKSKRFSLTALDQTEFRASLELATQSFGWGAIVTAVPLTFDDTTNDPVSFGNLLINPDKINMESVQFNAARTWGTPDYNDMTFSDQDIVDIDPTNNNDDKKIFQIRLCSKMMAKWLQGHLDKTSW